MTDRLTFTLRISTHLFRLTTESIRLRSNEIGRHVRLEELLADRFGQPIALEDLAPETIRAHLLAVPSPGDIPLELLVARSDAYKLETMQSTLAERLGCAITSGDVLSVMLLHYVAGQKVARILERVDLPALTRQLGQFESADATRLDNVTPLRP